MSYKYQNSRGNTYYLHSKDVTFRNGMTRPIYFFAKTIRENALDTLPVGYKVVESKRSAMPVLKKVLSE